MRAIAWAAGSLFLLTAATNGQEVPLQLTDFDAELRIIRDGNLYPFTPRNLVTSPLVPGTGKTPLQLEIELSEQWSRDGLKFGGDSVDLMLQINDASSIVDLLNRQSIKTITWENGVNPLPPGQFAEFFLDQNKAREFDARVSNLAAVFAEAAPVIEQNGGLADFGTEVSTNLELYRSFDALAEKAPASGALLKIMAEQAAFIEETTLQATRGALSGDDALFRIAEITDENRQREVDWSEAAKAGIDWSQDARVVVTLVDRVTGDEVERFRAQAVPPMFSETRTSLGLTSPAEGRLPLATFCFFAVEPGTEVRVTDIVKRSYNAMKADPGAPVELTFLGPQDGFITC